MTDAGSIDAKGSINDSIYFTYFDTTGFSNTLNTIGGWSGIFITINTQGQPNDSSIFDFCVIQYCKSYSNYFGLGSIKIERVNKTRISNSFIRNNYSSGIYCSSSSPLITKNKIMYNNSQKGGGGGIRCENSNPRISYNIISYNQVNNIGGGGIYCEATSQPKIINNFICNNKTSASTWSNYGGGGGGIYIRNSSSTYIANNVIANNYSGFYGGAGILISFCYAVLENNTIANNFSDSPFGGGILIENGNYCPSTSSMLVNNIIWGNMIKTSIGANILSNQIYLRNLNTLEPDIINCDLEGGINGVEIMGNSAFAGINTNNINMNPLFINPSISYGNLFNGLSVDWRLQNSSPSINAGINPGTLNAVNTYYAFTSILLNIDLWYNPRVTGPFIEIGAYEAPAENPDGINDFENNSSLSIYPNPTTDYFSVDYTKPYKQATIAIVNALGQVIENKTFNNSEKMFFNSNDFATGAYFLNIMIDDERMSSKLIIK